MCEMTLHAEVFNSRRNHLRTEKASKLLAAGDHTGELTPLPNCRPSQSPTSLSVLRARAKQLRGPQVTVEPRPLRALLRHCVCDLSVASIAMNKQNTFCRTVSLNLTDIRTVFQFVKSITIVTATLLPWHLPNGGHLIAALKHI